MIWPIIWVKWRSVKSSRKTKCLLMSNKMVKVIDFEANHYLFVALSDSNKAFKKTEQKLWERSHSFVCAPRASDERAKEGTDPKHCWTPLRLSELEMKQSWWLGWVAIFVTMASASLWASDETAEEVENFRLSRSSSSFMYSYWLVNA